jgi:uncharacterized protein (DUF302 family)
MEAMFIENPTRFSYGMTVDTLSETIAAKGWKVLVSHDLKEILDKKGYRVLPVTVIELCNPKYSSRLLARDEERNVASLMPCRVAVYEKSDGKTYVSRMNAELFAGMLGGVVEEVMTEAFREMESMIAEVIV